MKHDVAIVGAGPAGARAAYALARRGARVAIFDDSHPREKACGGGVTGRAVSLVADSIDLGTLSSTSIRSARFLMAEPQERGRPGDASVPLSAGALAVVSRTAFDQALLDAAVRSGAALHRSRVTNVAVDRAGVRIYTRHGTHHAGLLIGADGANSLVRRRVAAPFRRDQLSIATGYFARGATSSEIVIELTRNPPGYIWSFPRPDHLAIGICAQATAGWTANKLRERTAHWIRSTGLADGAPLLPYSWPIPSLSARDFEALTTAGPRWCLVGDAAGLVDPITREGIFFAIASGDWAAEAFSVSPAAGARAYSERIADEAAKELSRAARFKAGFFRPAFVSLLMAALRESEAIRSVMADLVAGEQSYRSLKWRLLKTFEIGLAWKSVQTLTSRSTHPVL